MNLVYVFWITSKWNFIILINVILGRSLKRMVLHIFIIHFSEHDC